MIFIHAKKNNPSKSYIHMNDRVMTISIKIYFIGVHRSYRVIFIQKKIKVKAGEPLL